MQIGNNRSIGSMTGKLRKKKKTNSQMGRRINYILSNPNIYLQLSFHFSIFSELSAQKNENPFFCLDTILYKKAYLSSTDTFLPVFVFYMAQKYNFSFCFCFIYGSEI